MSRYPGTQFRVHDNSQATAIVPVTNANVNDTVQYLTTFASVKGPEGITLTAGEDFYTRYGTQDNIDFKKYGQPLFQASMNVNNGAALLAKRAVLDDASLANATLAVVLTKYKDAKITAHSKYPDLISTITFSGDEVSKYSLAPMVFSIDNINNYVYAKAPVNEYKERYDLYKNYIEEVVSNENTPDNTFLNKLFTIKGENNKILSGFAQSVYYDAEGNLVDVNTEGVTDVRKVSSITTGIYSSNQKTYSSNFEVSDILDAKRTSAVNTINCATSKIGNASIWKLKKTTSENKVILTWEKSVPDPTYYDPVSLSIPINRVFNFTGEDSTIPGKLDTEVTSKHPEWNLDDYDVSNEYALVIPDIKIEGYTTTTRLMNDLMVEKSGYIECEYVFPMFTIFDNGRGESIKTIGIEYDAASSVTLKKAIYSLTLYNYATAKKLEKFSFSLNPYTRNNNTGYSLDIESAVNYVSKQISVKTYYESYDALLETLQSILQTTDNNLIENNDILFGHTLNGKYPAFNSYYVSTILRRNAYIYDYAHLDIFDNDIITVNAYCDSDNMTSIVSDSKVKYYYYNYIRQQKKLLEKLEKGTDGYCLSRQSHTNTKKVPFIVIDETDVNSGDDITTVSMRTIMECTGQQKGTVITDVTNDITNAPVVETNFLRVNLKLTKMDYYENGIKQDGDYYSTDNDNTKAKANVLAFDAVRPASFTGYQFTSEDPEIIENIFIPYSLDYMYQEQYRRFFNGDFDRDIFNLDVYFPNAVFDANYSESTKLAIQRLAAYRGDFMCYMDMGINKVNSYSDCLAKIPSTNSGIELSESADNQYKYVRDMHIAVTCLFYKIRNPYDNKVINVTATYGLSNLYIAHFKNDVSRVFAGISNGITINNIIEGSVNYIPKIYPTSEMTSLNNIGGVYPSDDETIVNEKQLLCDLKVNYGCYYDDRFSIETEYTMNPTESEFSYWNNVALVCLMMQSIRKACPTARYQFITASDLTVYKTAVETAMKPWRNRFADIKFKYVQDEAAIENKIFYAAIEVVFKPFAQAEIFELTALNYSTLSSNITSI